MFNLSFLLFVDGSQKKKLQDDLAKAIRESDFSKAKELQSRIDNLGKSRSAHTNNQYEFQIFPTNFCLLMFEYTLQGKSFEFRLKYIKKCQYNC